VYVELTGGRQRGLSLVADDGGMEAVIYTATGPRLPRPILPTSDEMAAHAAFVARLKEPVWTAC
jgi:DNA polymerase-3 subunit epsilon